MEPWLDDLTDDLQSMSFNSATSTNTTDIHRCTSSGSETTWTGSSSSAHHVFSLSFPQNPHSSTPSGDPCSDAIHRAEYSLSLSDIRFLHRLGSGNIRSVYLAEIKSPEPHYSQKPTLFAAKVMDKKEMASRNKKRDGERVSPFCFCDEDIKREFGSRDLFIWGFWEIKRHIEIGRENGKVITYPIFNAH